MTAEEVLKEWLSQTDQTNFKQGHYFVIEQAMKEYAKEKCQELLRVVAENAYAQVKHDCAIIDKDSILNTVDLDEFIGISPEKTKK